MAQKESTFTNMTVTLFLVTFIAASILGFVHDLTKEDIALAKMKAQKEAIENVLPAFETLGDSYKVLPADGVDSLEFFPAYDSSQQLIGVAVKTYTKNGFSGLITLMTGFSPNGTVTGYEILDHKETPGLGAKMGAWFKDETKPKQNIIGKSPATTKFEVSKDGGEVDAITASTITSRAFLDAVRRAYNTYHQNQENEKKTVSDTKEGGQS